MTEKLPESQNIGNKTEVVNKFSKTLGGLSDSIVSRANEVQKLLLENKAMVSILAMIPVFQGKIEWFISLIDTVVKSAKSKITGAVETKTTVKETIGSYAGALLGAEALVNLAAGKSLSILTPVESYTASQAVFGKGAGSDLLIAIDKKFGGSGEVCKRMIALGKHEGGLLFGRQNPDPASGYNIGTFQIGGAKSGPSESMSKYNSCLRSGISYYEKILGRTPDISKFTAADKDVIAHVGYIFSQRGGEGTLKMLADAKLTDEQLVILMHYKIQGGIRAIGEDVLAMTRKNSVAIKKSVFGLA